MAKVPYRLEFDDHGGYDSMSAAYIIYDANDKTVATVDVVNFTEPTSSYEDDHEPHPEAERIANLILERLNQ